MLVETWPHRAAADHGGSKMNTKQAIAHVLKGKRKMRVPDIIVAGVPLTELKGKTPGQTFYSVLYAENKKPDGLVTQTSRGMFKLNPNRRKADAPQDEKPASRKPGTSGKRSTGRKTASRKRTARR
jgi:hypothetical protein